MFFLKRRLSDDLLFQVTFPDAVKLFCGPMGKKVADNAIQVLGGMGYVGEGVVERLWRDAKLLEIGGGTVGERGRCEG